MGILYYFSYISKNYFSSITHCSNKSITRSPKNIPTIYGPEKISIDNLYLDLNAMIHPVCQKKYNYGPNKRLSGKFYPPKEEHVFSSICEYIYEIYNLVKPTKMLYIAIDGVAGAAKEAQQRQRRFKSSASEYFDPNCITTGTKFMDKLSAFITKNLIIKGIKILYSSHLVPGEGEHKIIRFIADLNNKENHCIFSPDADLIMLTLQLNNIYILRQNMNYTYSMININEIKKILHIELQWILESTTENNDGKIVKVFKESGYNKIEGIKDYILCCCLLGNDFISKTSLEIINNGLKILVDEYIALKCHFLKTIDIKQEIDTKSEYNELLKEHFKDSKETKIITRLCINKTNFKKLLSILASKESEMLISKKELQLQYPDVLIDQSFIDGKFDYTTYRILYYKKHFGLNVILNRDKQIEKICHLYLKTLTFIMRYYYEGIPSWTFKYKYHHAPLFIDIAKHIDTFDENVVFKKSKPADPIEQLLSVVPASSNYLLPVEYRYLLTDAKSPIIEYYPTKFEIECNGVKNDYESIPLIPFVKCKVLKKVYKSINSKIKKPVETLKIL